MLCPKSVATPVTTLSFSHPWRLRQDPVQPRGGALQLQTWSGRNRI